MKKTNSVALQVSEGMLNLANWNLTASCQKNQRGLFTPHVRNWWFEWQQKHWKHTKIQILENRKPIASLANLAGLVGYFGLHKEMSSCVKISKYLLRFHNASQRWAAWLRTLLPLDGLKQNKKPESTKMRTGDSENSWKPRVEVANELTTRMRWRGMCLEGKRRDRGEEGCTHFGWAERKGRGWIALHLERRGREEGCALLLWGRGVKGRREGGIKELKERKKERKKTKERKEGKKGGETLGKTKVAEEEEGNKAAFTLVFSPLVVGTVTNEGLHNRLQLPQRSSFKWHLDRCIPVWSPHTLMGFNLSTSQLML